MMGGTVCWAATTWTSSQLGCEQPGGHSTAQHTCSHDRRVGLGGYLQCFASTACVDAAACAASMDKEACEVLRPEHLFVSGSNKGICVFWLVIASPFLQGSFLNAAVYLCCVCLYTHFEGFTRAILKQFWAVCCFVGLFCLGWVTGSSWYSLEQVLGGWLGCERRCWVDWLC